MPPAVITRDLPCALWADFSYKLYTCNWDGNFDSAGSVWLIGVAARVAQSAVPVGGGSSPEALDGVGKALCGIFSDNRT